jgi:hypothetical protein
LSPAAPAGSAAVVERLVRDGAAVVFSLVEHGPLPTRLSTPSRPWAGRRGRSGPTSATWRPCGDCSRRPDGAWEPSTSWSTKRGRAADADAHRSDDRGGVRPRHGDHAKGVVFAIRHACARAGGSSTSRPSRRCCRRQHGDLQRSKAAIEQRLTVLLEVAEQASRAHPNRSTERVFWRLPAALLVNLWQMTLRAEGGDALCLVELRGSEPLTPCMPSRDQVVKRRWSRRLRWSCSELG